MAEGSVDLPGYFPAISTPPQFYAGRSSAHQNIVRPGAFYLERPAASGYVAGMSHHHRLVGRHLGLKNFAAEMEDYMPWVPQPFYRRLHVTHAAYIDTETTGGLGHKAARMRGARQEWRGEHFDSEFYEEWPISIAPGAMYVEGSRCKGTVSTHVTPTANRFSCTCDHWSDQWDNHRVRFITGECRNEEVSILSETLHTPDPDDEETWWLDVQLASDLPVIPAADDVLGIFASSHRFARFREPDRYRRWCWGNGYGAPILPGELETLCMGYYGYRLRIDETPGQGPAMDTSFMSDPVHDAISYDEGYFESPDTWYLPASFFEPLLALSRRGIFLMGYEYGGDEWLVDYGIAETGWQTGDPILGVGDTVHRDGVFVGRNEACNIDWYWTHLHGHLYDPFGKLSSQTLVGGEPYYQGSYPQLQNLVVGFVGIVKKGDYWRVWGDHGDDPDALPEHIPAFVMLAWGLMVDLFTIWWRVRSGVDVGPMWWPPKGGQVGVYNNPAPRPGGQAATLGFNLAPDDYWTDYRGPATFLRQMLRWDPESQAIGPPSSYGGNEIEYPWTRLNCWFE